MTRWVAALFAVLVAFATVKINAAYFLYANDYIAVGDHITAGDYKLSCNYAYNARWERFTTEIQLRHVIPGVGTEELWRSSNDDQYPAYQTHFGAGYHQAHWASSYMGSCYMGDDGNFVILGEDLGSGPVVGWSTSTYGNYGFAALQDDDGNFVIFDQYATPIWAVY